MIVYNRKTDEVISADDLIALSRLRLAERAFKALQPFRHNVMSSFNNSLFIPVILRLCVYLGLRKHHVYVFIQSLSFT